MSDRDFRTSTKAGKALIANLDTMAYADLVDELGPPDRVTVSMRGGGPGWDEGQEQPALASDDPATVQAMARCLTWRAATRSHLPLVRLVAGIHPRPCLWCDYPTDELRAAVDWAGWRSSLVETEYATWRGAYGTHYDRTTPQQGTYAHPAWAAFFSQVPDRAEAGRRRRSGIEAAMFDPMPPAPELAADAGALTARLEAKG